ncbi:MAG: tRNA (adenosine(37)-N6)-dimethylallyltransferase MiaA [Chloroflexi bacterium]|nr:tRNA (adenosine(37)-N6)-dimethylallyltransferase MiaA [Chloroflexota bacterium]
MFNLIRDLTGSPTFTLASGAAPRTPAVTSAVPERPSNQSGERHRLLVIVGPTAVGKSALALEVAQHVDAEIVSADSRQVYRFMDIGTAKPSQLEQAQVRHHLIDVADPDEDYTLALFQADAQRTIAEIQARGRLPLLVGGTGLYIRAICDGLVIPHVPPIPELRAELEVLAAREGPRALHARLSAVDASAAARIHPHNVRRVIRALEVFRQTGRPISAQQHAEPPPYDLRVIGLTTDRSTLYRRIDERVDAQIAAGLIDENRQLLAMGYDDRLPSMTGLGYRQIGLYLRGELTLEAAVQLLKHETHRFARQQYAWFRLDDRRIRWFRADPAGLEEAVRLATTGS